MTVSTITDRGIIIYTFTLFLTGLFIILAVLFTPNQEWGVKAALFAFALLTFIIGTVGFHIRQ